MITNVKPPVWQPDKRQWLIEYTVKDKDAGVYVQKVWCEALVSAERITNEIREKIRRNKQLYNLRNRF